MRAAQRKTIKSIVYSVTPLDADYALNGLIRIGNVFGPAFAKLAGTARPSADMTVADFVVFALPGAAELMTKLTRADVDFFMQLFEASTEVIEGAKQRPLDRIPTKAHFNEAGLWALFEWLAFCLVVNYADFFVDALGALQSLNQAQKAPVA